MYIIKKITYEVKLNLTNVHKGISYNKKLYLPNLPTRAPDECPTHKYWRHQKRKSIILCNNDKVRLI